MSAFGNVSPIPKNNISERSLPGSHLPKTEASESGFIRKPISLFAESGGGGA